MKIKRYYRTKPDEKGVFCLAVVTTCNKLMFFEHGSPITKNMCRRILSRVRKGKEYAEALRL